MEKYVYAVKDLKLEYGSNLLVCDNDDVAKRDFEMAVKMPGSLLNSHPEDFLLERIGVFDTKTAELIDISAVSIARATDFVNLGGEEVE